MNKLFSLVSRPFSDKIFIRNSALPPCLTCVHFIEHKNNYPYDPPPSDEQYGKCRKFGQVNLITGTIEHDRAADCRSNASQCGRLASEYSKKIIK